MHDISNIAEIVACMSRSSVDEDTIELVLITIVWILTINKVGEVGFQIERKEVVELDPIECLKIESEPRQGEYKYIGKLLQLGPQPHILLR